MDTMVPHILAQIYNENVFYYLFTTLIALESQSIWCESSRCINGINLLSKYQDVWQRCVSNVLIGDARTRNTADGVIQYYLFIFYITVASIIEYVCFI